jgi:hypothetical protein
MTRADGVEMHLNQEYCRHVDFPSPNGEVLRSTNPVSLPVGVEVLANASCRAQSERIQMKRQVDGTKLKPDPDILVQDI